MLFVLAVHRGKVHIIRAMGERLSSPHDSGIESKRVYTQSVHRMEIEHMNKPYEKTVTCKGNIPEKLAKVDIDADTLECTHVDTNVGDVDGLSDLCRQVAEAVIAHNTDEIYTGELWDLCNGEGYTKRLLQFIQEETAALAVSTAIQLRAFKATTIANTDDAPSDLFTDTAKKDGKKSKASAKSKMELLLEKRAQEAAE